MKLEKTVSINGMPFYIYQLDVPKGTYAGCWFCVSPVKQGWKAQTLTQEESLLNEEILYWLKTDFAEKPKIYHTDKDPRNPTRYHRAVRNVSCVYLQARKDSSTVRFFERLSAYLEDLAKHPEKLDITEKKSSPPATDGGSGFPKRVTIGGVEFQVSREVVTKGRTIKTLLHVESEPSSEPSNSPEIAVLGTDTAEITRAVISLMNRDLIGNTLGLAVERRNNSACTMKSGVDKVQCIQLIVDCLNNLKANPHLIRKMMDRQPHLKPSIPQASPSKDLNELAQCIRDVLSEKRFKFPKARTDEVTGALLKAWPDMQQSKEVMEVFDRVKKVMNTANIPETEDRSHLIGALCRLFYGQIAAGGLARAASPFR